MGSWLMLGLIIGFCFGFGFAHGAVKVANDALTNAKNHLSRASFAWNRAREERVTAEVNLKNAEAHIISAARLLSEVTSINENSRNILDTNNRSRQLN